MAETQSTLPFGNGQPNSDSGIYQIRCLTNGKLYVGSASDLRNRWAVHRHYLERGTHHSIKLQRAWNKHGREAFVFEVLELVPADRLVEVEQWYLDTYGTAGARTGYNVSPSSRSNRGIKKTDEQRRRMSEQRMGKPQHPNARAGIAAYWTGRTQTAETKAKKSSAMRGRVFTEEWRRRLSIAASRKRPEAHDARTKDPVTGIRRALTPEQVAEALSLMAAGVRCEELAVRYGCSASTMRNVKAGRYPSSNRKSGHRAGV